MREVWNKFCCKTIDVILIAVFTILAYQLLWTSNGFRLYRQLQTLENNQRMKLDKLTFGISELRNKQYLLQNDEIFLEGEARMLWGMVKPKETLVWYENMEG
jgi:cell division protein FtsB